MTRSLWILALALALVWLAPLASAQENGPRVFSFAGAPDSLVTAAAISCPGSQLPPGTWVTGTITQSTGCAAIVNTRAGAINVVGHVYSIHAVPGTELTVTLDSGKFLDYFGLPYIVLINAADQPVAAAVGTDPAGDRTRAILRYTITSADEWRVLVTGVGGDFSYPVGDYRVLADYSALRKRRAVRK